MTKKLFTITLLMPFLGLSQNVGINTSTPDPSAVLEISASDRGMLIPRVALQNITDISTIENPAVSLLVYNTATSGNAPNNVSPGFHYWDGTKWKRFEGSGGSASNDWSVDGNSNTQAGINFLGTINNQDLVFKRENKLAGRLNSQSTSFGLNALSSNWDGPNTAYGNGALQFYFSANGGNTAIGIDSQKNSFEARANTSLGYRSLEALHGNTPTDDGNTAIGHSSLLKLKTGLDNVALGYNALKFIEGGNNNLGIGKDVEMPAWAVGTETPYTANNQMNIMNTIYGINLGSVGTMDDDLIGIATREPSQTLDVAGNVKVRGQNSAISNGDTCSDPGTISFGSDGNFYGCTGNNEWKLLNN